MFNKILAPLDGSPLSECSIEHVKTIATGCHAAEVVFLTVMEPEHNAYWSAQGDPDLETRQKGIQRKNAENYIAKVAADARKGGLNAKGLVLDGDPADVIVKFAGENGIDFIVMSTHGYSGVTRFALGSVTDKVLRTAAAIVMVVSPRVS